MVGKSERTASLHDSLESRLKERVKELTALHAMARLLQAGDRPLDQVMQEVVALIPGAWQYPECTEGCITLADRSWKTPGFRRSAWGQVEEFTLRNDQKGKVEVVYTTAQPRLDEGPFLREERDLIRSLADMLQAFLQHHLDDEAICAANEKLEDQVAERTASLRRLTNELCLTEERERRRIAEDLHDHLGQGLALMKIKLRNLRGDTVFEGHDGAINELLALCDQSIRYTRNLTFELSPPVLYELGLGAALDWLAEDTSQKHGLKVEVSREGREIIPDQLRVMLWKSGRELLHNAIKHADCKVVHIKLEVAKGQVLLEVTDDGRGFDCDRARRQAGDGYGLFSIEERLGQLGGAMTIITEPERGTTVRLAAPTGESNP
jgi:signal transduction histidine kinase